MIKTILLLLVVPGFVNAQFVMSGYVKDITTGESLVGVSVMATNQKRYTTTNNYGYYSISLNAQTTLEFSLLGYEKFALKVATENANIRKDIELNQSVRALEAVNVTAESINQSERLLSGIKLTIKQIKDIPAFLGEKDVVKAIQFLPGVQRGVEGSSAFFVRGGSGDQNLIILDDAVVYNANHFFGFFSVFNPDAIKSVEFYKGGFPARFGGRLSSILDIQMKEGSRKGLHGEGGIGILASRLTLEGPIQKNKKSSFLVSARRTYLDPFLYLIGSERSRFNYSFYDLNAKINFDIGSKDKLFISGYAGNDKLTVTEIIKNSNIGTRTFISKIGWGNNTFTTRWNHLFNEKLFSNTTATFTNYASNLIGISDFKSSSETSYRKDAFATLMRDFGLKTDFEFYPNATNQIKFGVNLTNHLFIPTSFEVNNTKFNNENKEVYNNVEASVYAEDILRLADKLLLHSGLRFNAFFAKNKTYLMPEPRLSLSYATKSNYFLKASYVLVNQYINLLSNNSQGLSSDLWVPATDKFAPQRSQIYTFGVEKTLPKSQISLSSEIYFKQLNRLIAIKEGASIVGYGANPAEFLWEENVTSGKGISFGSEWMIRKSYGRLTGLASYTWSKTINVFAELNQGKPFYPRQDIRHNFNFVGSFDIMPKIKISASWLFASGTPVTIPLGFFLGFYAQTGGIQGFSPNYNAYYGGRNNTRTTAYHRADLNISFTKKKKKFVRTWELGAFNVYNRSNIFYYSTRTVNAQKGFTYDNTPKSLLPVVPSVTYAFKF